MENEDQLIGVDELLSIAKSPLTPSVSINDETNWSQTGGIRRQMTTGSQRLGKFEELTLSSTNQLGAESVSPPSIKPFTRKRENDHTLINNT